MPLHQTSPIQDASDSLLRHEGVVLDSTATRHDFDHFPARRDAEPHRVVRTQEKEGEPGAGHALVLQPQLDQSRGAAFPDILHHVLRMTLCPRAGGARGGDDACARPGDSCKPPQEPSRGCKVPRDAEVVSEQNEGVEGVWRERDVAGIHKNRSLNSSSSSALKRLWRNVDGGNRQSAPLQVECDPSWSASDIEYMAFGGSDCLPLILPPLPIRREETFQVVEIDVTVIPFYQYPSSPATKVVEHRLTVQPHRVDHVRGRWKVPLIKDRQ